MISRGMGFGRSLLLLNTLCPSGVGKSMGGQMFISALFARPIVYTFEECTASACSVLSRLKRSVERWGVERGVGHEVE